MTGTLRGLPGLVLGSRNHGAALVGRLMAAREQIRGLHGPTLRLAIQVGLMQFVGTQKQHLRNDAWQPVPRPQATCNGKIALLEPEAHVRCLQNRLKREPPTLWKPL